MNDNDQNGADLGWSFAFGLLGLFSLFVILQSPSLHEVACKPEEQDCFRQWMTALGGWVAVVAAVPTIYFLSKQIRSTSKQQAAQFAISVRADAALAKTVHLSARELLAQIDHLEVNLSKQFTSRDYEVAAFIGGLSWLLENYRKPAWAEFESRISPASNITNALLCFHLETQMDQAKNLLAVASALHQPEYEGRLNNLRAPIKTARTYASDAVEAVEEFFAEKKELETYFS